MEAQLVELLQMLSSGLRAGFGLLQALEAAAEQTPGAALRRARGARCATPRWARASSRHSPRSTSAIGSPDFDIVITAILIQRSVGGNLAEILDNVAHTMRERERIRGEIRTLTSQQRMTGYVIGGIPVGLLLRLLHVISPEFTVAALHRSARADDARRGQRSWRCMGFMVIQKIVNIEV